MSKTTLRLGVISDTHGLLRPEAVAALRGSDVIIHAGDVGTASVIDGLREIAPTFAIRGNVDSGSWAVPLDATALVDVGKHVFYVLHNVADLDLDPPAAGFAAVVFGHSHKPSIETRDGVLWLNPGSAGPRRFRLPITLARVAVTGTELKPEIVELVPGPKPD
jgi:putative phosphoesterase